MTCGSEHCTTCADEGVEMTIVALDAAPGLAWCAGPERAELVEVSLLESAVPGDRILVHAGTAIAWLAETAR